MRFRLIILSLAIGLSATAAPPDSLLIHSTLAGEDHIAYINLPGGYSHDKFLAFIKQELIPAVETKYGAGTYQQFVEQLQSGHHQRLQLQSRIPDLSGYTGIYTDGKDSIKIIAEQQSLTAILGRFHFEKDGQLSTEFYNRHLTLKKQDTLTARTGPQLIGSTRDLSRLDVRQFSLKKGQSDTSGSNGDDVLIIVRNGKLKVNDTKTLGPGGVALFSAGDPISLTNADAKTAGYYVFRFRSWATPDHDRAEKAGPPILLDWTEMKMKTTDKGESRQIFDRPTAWLKRIDMHATTLNKGQVSHPPHIHRNEEIILMRSGNVAEYVAGAYQKAKAGDIIFLTSGTPHAVENRTNGRCEYFALQWQQ